MATEGETVTTNGPNHPGAQDERGETQPIEQVQGEIVQHEEHGPAAHEGPGAIEVRIPAPLEPAPPRTIAVRPKVAQAMLLALFLLAVLVAALLYVLLKPGDKTTTAASTGSPSPTSASASVTPSAVALPSASGAESASASADASSSASGQSTDSAVPNSSFTPINGTAPLGAPVDNGAEVSTNVDVTISNVDYPNSVTLNCANSATTDWDVAGYASFTTTLGIPDTARGATGSTITMTFANENGQTLDVAKTSIGQPANVRIPLTGVHRLAISCTRQSSNGYGYNQVALGNASFSGS
jgi:hypothetical protein